jgi:crotonobetainyl-CoA:carnitine CoA-transferase CaiB-like acyl-CoA transferase
MCEVIGKQELMNDARFTTNSVRVQNRDELLSILKPIFVTKPVNEWLSLIGDEFPCGAINNLEQTFSMPQVEAREMLVHMQHPTIGDLPLVGSPLKFSDTPVEYKLPPPRLGEHTEEVLKELPGS